MTLEVVPVGTDKPVRVRATMPAVHLCPFKHEVDEGTAEVRWTVTEGQTVELHSLRAYLDSLDEWEVSHERYTEHVRDLLTGFGLRNVGVVTTWSTAGGTITVHAG